jgi:hypothetical protein
MLDIANEYANHLAEKHIDYDFTVEHGKKFDRIVQTNRRFGTSRMVHAFVERTTGKLIKPSGWSAPQKDVDGLAYRYDLSTPEGFAEAVFASDPHGSYLYKQ